MPPEQLLRVLLLHTLYRSRSKRLLMEHVCGELTFIRYELRLTL